MRYRVVALRKAEFDVRCIVTYIKQHSREGAIAWLNAYRRARLRLADYADGCSVADENDFFEIDVREMLFKTRRGRIYRMIFTIVEKEVRILRVRGPGQADLAPGDM